MSKRILIPLAIVALAGLAFTVLVASKPSHPPALAQAKVWQVDVVHVQPGRHAPQVTLFGNVESPHAADLAAALGAEIKALLAHEGDAVAAGTELVLLDDADYRLALDQREAELAEVRAQLDAEHQRHATDLASLEDDLALLTLYRNGVERETDLLKKDLGSASRADDARKLLRQQALQVKQRRLAISGHDTRLAELEAQATRVESLRERAALDLDRTRVRAPFDAVVTATHVSPGDRVRAGDLLLSLYDRDAIEIRAQLPSRYVADARDAVASGSPPTALLDTGQRRLPLSVSRLAGRIQPGSGGLDLLFALPGRDHGLALGQTVRLQFQLPERADIVALPAAALYGNGRVYVVRDERLHAVDVEVVGTKGAADGDSRVLVSAANLAVGEPVITTQLPTAVEGLPVHINE